MDPRYSDQAISQIWSRRRQIGLWAWIETVWIQQHSETGFIDASRASVPTIEQVDDRERATHHEFTAFLDLWTERFESDEAARWCHFGLTSSDVIDTALAVVLCDSNRYLAELLLELTRALENLMVDVAGMQQVGRTHGQWAQPRSAAIPVRALWWMAYRARRRLSEAGFDLAEADFSGPTGGGDMLDQTKVANAMAAMKMRRATASTQILPRDAWVHWAHVVAHVVTVCEAIAEHYWMLAQSEIAEVEVVNGAGSSAMPHKRGNPHRAENVRGLARLARALASSLDQSMVQRGDRDLAHSSVERVALPDLCHLAATALVRTLDIIQDYRYAPEWIERNLIDATEQRADSALVASRHVLAGATRDQAIARTREEMK